MFAQIALPSLSQKESSWLKDLFLIVIGSILIALCAPLSIKLPFSPVPLALAPQLCLALGATLGKRRAALAVIAYLVQGMMGLPVFAGGGFGVAYLLGPTGGYLIGYVAGAYLVGYLIERMRERTGYKVFATLAAGSGVIYLLGAIHLSSFIGIKGALVLGVLPFLLGDVLKLMVVYRGIKRFI